MLCKRCECVWERARAGANLDSATLRGADKIFFFFFFPRPRPRPRSSKNDDVSHKSILFVGSAELSFKSMPQTISPSFAFKFDECFAKATKTTILAETFVKNRRLAIRAMKPNIVFWRNVSAETHIFIVFTELSFKSMPRSISTCFAFKFDECFAKATKSTISAETSFENGRTFKNRRCFVKKSPFRRVRRTVVQIDASDHFNFLCIQIWWMFRKSDKNDHFSWDVAQKWTICYQSHEARHGVLKECLSWNTHFHCFHRTVVQIDASEHLKLQIIQIWWMFRKSDKIDHFSWDVDEKWTIWN